MKKSIKNSLIIYILSFAIPMFIAIMTFYNLSIYPGGSNTLLIYDMRAQLLALYGYLSNRGAGYDTLFHSMAGGLGGGYFGTMALYVSPFDLIYSLVPVRYLPDAIYFMTITKIGFCGLFCSIYVSKQKEKLPGALIVTLSCCYALMSYNFMYSMSPMWLDLVMFLPLLALLADKLLAYKKCLGFVILMAFCIISDYYIAFMTAIALGLYVVFRLVEEQKAFKESVGLFLRFAVHGLISAGIAAVVIIPVVLDFRRGKLMEDLSERNPAFIKNSILDIFQALTPSHYNTLDYTAPPNIFCGTLVLVLALIWFVLGRKNIRSRITGLIIVVFYFVSFIIGPVDRIWHGFRDPIGFSVRYAFTFVFFMICFAIRGYKSLSETNLRISRSFLGLLGALFIGYTYLEMYINGSYILSRLAVEQRYANRDEYDRYADSMENILKYASPEDEDYSRIFKDFRYSRYDGALYGYDGLERFSSSYNYAVSDFLSKLGVGTSRHTISEYGMTPPVAGFLDMGYFISGPRDYSDYFTYLGEYRGFNLYSNEYKLPLIFATDIVNPPADGFDSDIPFENINSVFSDICTISDEDESVFEKFNYSQLDSDLPDAYKPSSLGYSRFLLSPEESGHYFFYSEYVDPDQSRYKDAWQNGEFSEVEAYADYYLNDELISMFRNDEFSYCNDIGCLDSGMDYVLSLDTSLSDIGATYIYRYNDRIYKQICEYINNSGFTIRKMDGTGIEATGYAEKDSWALISLPYENGYEILVDGVKTDYESYRGALILVKLSAGNHEISIRYITPGFRTGLVISIMFVICCIFAEVCFLLRKRKIASE